MKPCSDHLWMNLLSVFMFTIYCVQVPPHILVKLQGKSSQTAEVGDSSTGLEQDLALLLSSEYVANGEFQNSISDDSQEETNL